MIGEIPYSAKFSMEELARSCTENETWSFAILTSLHSAEPPKNIANFVMSPSDDPRNDLAIVAKGAVPVAPAALLFTANIYVKAKLTDVDVYRLT